MPGTGVIIGRMRLGRDKIFRLRAVVAIVLIVGGGLICSSFRQQTEVISGDLAKLIGDYTYICSYNGDKKNDTTAAVEKYTLRITKNSELLLYHNGKKHSKYHFSDVKIPIDYPYDYVMFQRKEKGAIHNYPLFYKGDTVVMHLYPFEFQDNYFRKTIK